MMIKDALGKRGAAACMPVLLSMLLIPAVAFAQQPDTKMGQYPGSRKIVVFKRDAAGLEAVQGLKPSHVIEYPDRRVYIVKDAEVTAMGTGAGEGASVAGEMNKIYLRDRVIDTTKPIPSVPQSLKARPTAGGQLFLIQFAGPIKGQWLQKVKDQGSVRFVTYVPNNAYIIWTDGATLQKLQESISSRPFIQWMGEFHPAYRIHPALKPMMFRAPGSEAAESGDVKVTVQFVEHEGVGASVNAVKAIADEVIRDAWTVGPYRNLRVAVPQPKLTDIANLPDVVNVEMWLEPKLFGERQGQILANRLDVTGSQPTGPGYLGWLNGLGFTANFSFAVNVTDSGLDRGRLAATDLHPDFLDTAGNGRVTYVQRVSGSTISTLAADNVDTDGHGTINHAIVGGFNNTADTPGSGTDFEDAAGFQYGLGIAPFTLLTSSRIFSPGWTNPDHTELTNAAYENGARISSNSWGSSCPPSGCCPPGVLGAYDTTSQEYDALVRDARPSGASDGGQPGNQEMVIVFAAGNQGNCANQQLGNNGSTAKNTLVVGAGENFNQTGTDGCGVTDAGANDARDVINFSSRGPTQDNRVKPDIMGPGTHIYGAASQDPAYNGGGVCDQYRPPGQTLYAWSSGTSHSTPAVAGAAALVRQWFLDRGLAAPSPAMTKAYLMNSATWMTGVGANDTLPSVNQGMGRVNLERAFDAVPRILEDQTTVLDDTGDTFTVNAAIADSAEPFRVTLAWTDAPGSAVGNSWVNDLDLEVSVDDGTGPVLYRGNNFVNALSRSGGTADFRNNVESVWLPAGTTGSFTVTVRAGNIAGDGVPNSGDAFDQDFALVVYNASAAVTPQPQVSVVLDPDVRLGNGDTSTARATVTLSGAPQAGRTVNFRTGDTGLATVSPPSAVTDASGVAAATVTGRTSQQDTTTLTAEIATDSDTVTVRVPDLSVAGVVLLVICLTLLARLISRRRVSQRHFNAQSRPEQ